MKHSKFAVSPFEIQSGTSAWRVGGDLNGIRIRRNFKTREEAAAEQAALELKRSTRRTVCIRLQPR